MPTFAFSVTVSGLTNEPEQLTRLFTEAFTIVPSEIDGVFSMSVFISASSSEDAVHRFDCHMQEVTPEISIVRLDEDLVSTTEIAERVDASRETVRLWATGRRRQGFPAHRIVLTGGVKLWAWADVYEWLAKLAKISPEEPRPLSTDCVDWYNGHLVTRRREPIAAKSDFSPDWEPAAHLSGVDAVWPMIAKSHRHFHYEVTPGICGPRMDWLGLAFHGR
jgi:hypothetical protein